MIVITEQIDTIVYLIVNILGYFAHNSRVLIVKLELLLRLYNFNTGLIDLYLCLKIMLYKFFDALQLIKVYSLEESLNNLPLLPTTCIADFFLYYYFRLLSRISQKMLISSGFLIQLLHDLSGYCYQDHILIEAVIEHKQILFPSANQTVNMRFAGHLIAADPHRQLAL